MTASPALHGPHLTSTASQSPNKNPSLSAQIDTLWYWVFRERERRRPLIILDLPNLKICTVEKIQRRYPARGRLMQRAAVPEVARADDGVDEVWTLGMMSVR